MPALGPFIKLGTVMAAAELTVISQAPTWISVGCNYCHNKTSRLGGVACDDVKRSFTFNFREKMRV